MADRRAVRIIKMLGDGFVPGVWGNRGAAEPLDQPHDDPGEDEDHEDDKQDGLKPHGDTVVY